MRKATALLGLAAITTIVGFKISQEPAYKNINDAFLHNPSPLQLFNPDLTASLLAKDLGNDAVEGNFAATRADSLIKFANRLLGNPYIYGGNSPGGFDCSGFTNYVYGKFGLDVPHGSTNQANSGRQISVEQARIGDLLIFTGTNLSVREPGHAGIVISKKGQPIRFIHASSNGGVKISEVEGTRYSQRLLQVRRIL